MDKSKYCLLTNDVETISVWNHFLSDKTGEKVLKEGMPLLLELYEKYGVRATFFFTGHIARRFPEIVKMVLPYHHEVGCHGMFHEADRTFDVLTYRQQLEHLKMSKCILEDISNDNVVSFRAPALRVNKDTPKALMKTGFLIDSSIAPQRADMLLSFGIREKLKWFYAPRKPYFTSHQSLAHKGKSDLFEIPISALLLPYIGTSLRIAPYATVCLRMLLHLESKLCDNPLVFLIHPNEVINEKVVKGKTIRRSKNCLSYILGDVIRHKVKLRNLGHKALTLYEKEVKFFFDNAYKFVTLTGFYQKVER